MLSRSIKLLPALRKSVSLNAPASSVFCQSMVRYDHHGPPANYKYPTMDDLPVPCGSWQEHYNNQQRKYNIHLLLGVGMFTISMAVGYFSHVFDLYMFPPERPSPKLP